MHRFFCTVCKKVKRVHADPFTDERATAELALHENKEPVQDRLGVCRWHVERLKGNARALVNSRGKVRTPNIKKAKAQPQQKGRK